MNKYTYLAIGGLLFWLAKTAYFGWNQTPINATEAVVDNIAFIMIVWGVLGDILSNVTWQKSTHISVVKEDLSDVIKTVTD